MNTTQLCQTIINQWQQDYQQLHDILNNEQSALESRDFDALTQAVKDKDHIVKQINAHQLPALTNKNGISIRTFQDFKAHCIREQLLNSSWLELMNLVEKCCFKNEVNARLISLLEQSNKRTFNLIKGFDPDNSVYNASGNRTTVRHYNSSVSA